MRLRLLGEDGHVGAPIACPAGERLLDALDEARAGFPFGCRSGTCGVCLLRIVSGAEHLAAPDPIERRALSELGAAPDERLACRATAQHDEGEVQAIRVAPAET